MLHIYNQNLEFQDSIPRTMSQVEEFGISTLYPKWQTNWYLSEVKYNYPKLVDGNLTEKTETELKLEGTIPLQDGEVIIGGDLITKEKIEGYKVVWNGNEWVETATQEEIEEHNFKESVNFYNSELEYASKATAELACEIIDQETFESVKEYMKAIDPYSQATRKVFSRPQRPPVFDRYN